MSVTSAIDAIVSDITANRAALSLPVFQTAKYARPLVETPEMCPLLAVFSYLSEPTVLATTGDYERHDTLIVAWYESVVASLDTGVVDPVAASAAIQRAEAITQHLETYSVGVPGLAAPNEATLEKVRYGHVAGGIWAAEIHLVVTTWS